MTMTTRGENVSVINFSAKMMTWNGSFRENVGIIAKTVTHQEWLRYPQMLLQPAEESKAR